MTNLKNLIYSAREMQKYTSLSELRTAVENRKFTLFAPDEDNVKALREDIKDILQECDFDTDNLEADVFALAVSLEYDWWSAYDITSAEMGAWLYLYTDGCKVEPDKQLLSNMRNFRPEYSTLAYDGCYDELISLDVLRETTSSKDTTRNSALAKFRTLRRRGFNEDDKKRIFNLIKETCLSNEGVMIVAMDIPRRWLNMYNVKTIAQAGWLMQQVRRAGKLTKEMLVKMNAENADVEIDESYSKFIEICVDKHLSMNLGPYTDEDEDDDWLKVYTIEEYVKEMYGDRSFASIGKLLEKIYEEGVAIEAYRAVDVMFTYVAVDSAAKTGERIVAKMTQEFKKNSYTKQEVINLLGFLVNDLSLSETVLTERLSVAIDNKIL